MPHPLKARLQKAALEACRALLVRDYARVDMRLRDTGDIYIIEVNANCDLARGSEFAAGAQAAGIDYVALINRIADLAMERRRPHVAARRAMRAAAARK